MNLKEKKVQIRIGLIHQARNVYTQHFDATAMITFEDFLNRFKRASHEYAMAEVYRWNIVRKQEKRVLAILEEDLLNALQRL